MAKSQKTGRVLFAVGVAESEASLTTVKARTLKQADLPEPLSLLGVAHVVSEAKESAPTYQDEVGMTLIHQGSFLMGDEEGARDERPQREVTLDDFWIDRYPVTNRDYRAFVEATGHRKPPHWLTGMFPEDSGKHPVTNVSYDDAQAYARWAGKRLPTEAEWEKAARGTIGQTYPWGDAFRKDHVNSSNEYGGTTPVDAFPGGSSPYGVLDMVGNVMDWCQDWYYDEFYERGTVENPTGPAGGKYRCVRGGFYLGNKSDVRCAARHWAPQANRQDHIGFRCAKTPLAPGQELPPMETQQPAGMQQIPEDSKMIPITEDLSLSEIAQHHPESVAKAIRARLNEPGDAGATGEAAILMITLGREIAATVMKYLLDTEIEEVARAMAARKVVTADDRNQAHEAIRSRILSGTHLDYGGPDYTCEVLEMAVGPRKARALLDRSVPEASPTQPLMNLDVNQAVPFLSKEHPQTIALILSRLDAKKAMAILMGLDEELRNDVIFRMGSMESVRARTLRSLEEALADSLRSMIMGQVEVGGPRAVADVLRHAGEEKDAILSRLRERDAGLAGEVEQSEEALESSTEH